MKWPKEMLLIRHDVSAYNILKDKKAQDEKYKEFLAEFKKNPDSEIAKGLARDIQNRFALGHSDPDTPLIDEESKLAEEVGKALHQEYDVPDIIFVSPYERTKMTLKGLIRGWTALQKVKIVEDGRIREQEHGTATLYNDWRVFQTLEPQQRILYEMSGPYWYRYPQGESVEDVRERNRSWISAIIRDFSEKRVLVVTHHLNILALRANLERWSAEKFIDVDHNDKPINCRVTLYEGHPNEGTDGKFKLKYYNKNFYTAEKL